MTDAQREAFQSWFAEQMPILSGSALAESPALPLADICAAAFEFGIDYARIHRLRATNGNAGNWQAVRKERFDALCRMEPRGYATPCRIFRGSSTFYMGNKRAIFFRRAAVEVEGIELKGRTHFTVLCGQTACCALDHLLANGKKLTATQDNNGGTNEPK